MADVGHGEPIDRCSLCHGDACPFTGSSTVYDRAFGPEEPELTDRVASLADEPDTWLQGDAFPVGSRRDYHGVSGLGDIDGGLDPAIFGGDAMALGGAERREEDENA